MTSSSSSSHNNNNNVKIHEHCKVAPPPTTTQTTSIPLTLFDLFWLRFHPSERIFFYTLPISQSHPSFFFNKLVPNLKASLSLTLQHFLPLAGNVIWPSESERPIIQYTPDDVDNGVSLLIAESDADFNHVQENSPHQASLSRSFIPNLESNDSFASVISLQITFFPNCGFSIGISIHHAVLDGISTIMFIKAWAYLCKKIGETESEESPTLLPELEALFDREIVKDPKDLSTKFTNNWTKILSKMFTEQNMERSLKIFPFEPKLEDSVRATFQLTREDLDKIKKKVLAKWEVLDGEELKPKYLSTFVVTCSYVAVCIAKAIQGIETKREKFGLHFPIDCRGRLETPIPKNYFGNCIWGQLVDAEATDFLKEEGVFLVAKRIHEKLKMMNEKGVFVGMESLLAKFSRVESGGVESIGVSGSNRFGVYEIDFGWGKPSKLEIISIDRGLTFALAESRDGSGGVEVGLVLNSHVMNLFTTLFHQGLRMN